MSTDSNTKPDASNPTHVYRQLVPAPVIVLEMKEDMLLEAGSVLIIPLHNPNNFVSMSRKLFDVSFLPEGYSVAPEPVVPVKEPEAPKVEPKALPVAVPAPPPKVVEPAVKPEAAPKPTLTYAQNWVARNGHKQPQAAPIPPSPAPKKPVLKVPEGVSAMIGPRANLKKLVDGVTPQLGRIIVAMSHVLETTCESDLAPSMLDGVLTISDRKQYAARIPTAIELGLVERAGPIPYSRGYCTRLTPAGVEAAKKLNNWPWVFDNLTPPEWLST